MKPSDLLLGYSEWKALEKPESPEFQAWLAAWELHDLIADLADDEKRKLIRLGHYCGWFDAKKGG